MEGIISTPNERSVHASQASSRLCSQWPISTWSYAWRWKPQPDGKREAEGDKEERKERERREGKKDKVSIRASPNTLSASQFPPPKPPKYAPLQHWKPSISLADQDFEKMTMKKGRKRAMESPPSCSFLPVRGQTATARFKHRCLLQDYEELRKEIESKKKQLQKAKHKKLKFLAEVKFLQRKYRDLSKNPSGIAQYGLKKRLEGIPFQLIDNVQYSNLAIQKVASIVGEDSDPSTSKIIDLNQNAEAMEVRVTRGLLKMNCSMKEDLLDSDLKLSLSGHGQTGVNRAGDRKITWHDQVEAFRV